MKKINLLSWGLFVLLLFSVMPVNAATITVISSCYWSSLSGGSGTGGLPGSADIVIVSGATLSVDGTGTTDVCGTLMLGDNNGNGTLSFSSSASKCNISGNLVIGYGTSFTGSIDMTNGGTLILGGTVTVNDAGTWASGAGTVEYNGSSAQTLPAAFMVAYNTLDINNTAGATLGAATTVKYLVIGDVTSGSVFSDGGYQITGNASGTLSAGAGSTLNIGLTSSTNVTTFPTNFITNNITLNGTSTVNYQGNIAQNISNTPTYGNLTINTGSSGTTKTALGALTITGNFTISTNTTFDGVAFIHNLAGNWINNGSFILHTNTVNFDGTSQIIGGSQSTTFYNLNTTGSTNVSTSIQTHIYYNLSIGNGTTFTSGNGLDVLGTTTIGGGTSGSLIISTATGPNWFMGVTISNGATWDNSGNSAVEFKLGITNNGTFTAGSGIQTFDMNSQSLNGTLSIPNVTAGQYFTLTNKGSLTVGTALTGLGAFTNSATGTFNIGGNCSIATLNNSGTATITGSGNISTVLANFTNNGTFNLNGSGTIAGITNGTGGIVNLISSGTITGFNNSAATSTLIISANNVPAITTLTTTAAGNTVNYTGTGQSVIIVNYYNLTFSGSGTETLNNDLTVNNNLNIGSGEVLDVNAGNNLTVSGNITNDGSLILESSLISSVVTSASLINMGTISGVGTATVKRYIPVNTDPMYHYLSSPISGATLSEIYGGSIYGNYNMYSFDVSTQSWKRVYCSDEMIPGQGYATVYKYSSPSNYILSFTGTLNTGAVSTSVSGTTGWDLLGNPYPFSIDLQGTNGFFNNNTSLNGTAYFWIDDASGGCGYKVDDYTDINCSGSTHSANGQTACRYVGTGQAFFIQSSGATTAAFSDAMKVTGNNNKFFIPGISGIQRFWLGVTDSNKNYNEILIAFTDQATEGFDRNYDGIKLKGNPEIAFYSLMNNDTNEYSIQGLPPLDTTMIIPLGLDANVGGKYIFKLKSTENFGLNKILLEDLKMNKTIDLTTDSAYTFTTIPGVLKNRFVIKFTGKVSSGISCNSSGNNDLIKLYNVGNTVFFNNLTGKPVKGKITVYSLLGEEIMTRNLGENDSENILAIHGCSGYYIVAVNTGEYYKTLKMFVK